MNKPLSLLPGCLSLLLVAGCRHEPTRQAGPNESGAYLVPTDQWLHPAGQTLEFGGRPVDLVLSPDARTLWVKDMRGLLVVDVPTWSIRQRLDFPAGGASTHGIVVTRDGRHVYVTTAQDSLWEAIINEQGTAEWGRRIVLPGPGGRGNSHPAGIALSSDETQAWVCLSRNNSLALVDLVAGDVGVEIPVGVAPYDVVAVPNGGLGFVSNWGGRQAQPGDRTATSSGTEAVVDERGVASTGTVSVVDLAAGWTVEEIAVGLHPSDLLLADDGGTLYVANANSDSVSVLDVASRTVRETLAVRPEASLPFGSAPNALALGPDGTTLYVANGGNNAVAVFRRGDAGSHFLEGFIPTAWYPGALASDATSLFIANVKGFGSRNRPEKQQGYNSHNHLGTVGRVPVPDDDTLAGYTRQVRQDARVPEMLRAWEKSRSPRAPQPVPQRLGDPSVFEHVVYIIKENRTYDQVFGDLPRGNGDPSLCVFGRETTPNHHALAEQFVLLDNYYCNGVLSADGHAWATEGYATDYLEKSFGGFTRSYPYSGDDPLSFASSGFLWDKVLLAGLSFRNYGEMSKSWPVPRDATYETILKDHETGAGAITFDHKIWIDPLRAYSCPNSPGWNMRIPDAIRAEVFLDEFRDYERQGTWPNLVIVYLPSDHTSGTSPGNPTPRAQVADNDLAVGRIVEAVSQSSFWATTCIFVIEDDPQAGFDHVDGHRSLCLVASPYTKRGKVVSNFYNQTSVLHTIERMLGVSPMNQMDALAPLMTECFTRRPDLTPYTCQPNRIPLDEMNQPLSALEGAGLHWAQASLAQPLDDVDQADEDTLNRIIWHSVKGVDAPYPAQLAGAHGTGLKALHLVTTGEDDDDD
ncbi:MAG: bifunctional YncE family protein/alkaline phosphatase family protein [Verrucomicrobiales bacterium]|nr:bifunctional YncE family protein/alkaline phosphatase family protein [Verrucomicrobiales bacterium]